LDFKCKLKGHEFGMEFFAYLDTDSILRKKGLLDEIHQILGSVKNTDHRAIQNQFLRKGWELEHRIFPQVSWAWDAYKDKAAVSIELSLIDAVHRDFLRAILGHKQNKLNVLVYVTSTFKEPRFENVRRDIEIFKGILDVPILLIGLDHS